MLPKHGITYTVPYNLCHDQQLGNYFLAHWRHQYSYWNTTDDKFTTATGIDSFRCLIRYVYIFIPSTWQITEHYCSWDLYWLN